MAHGDMTPPNTAAGNVTADQLAPARKETPLAASNATSTEVTTPAQAEGTRDVTMGDSDHERQ